jgi:hypothetical protein
MSVRKKTALIAGREATREYRLKEGSRYGGKSCLFRIEVLYFR